MRPPDPVRWGRAPTRRALRTGLALALAAAAHLGLLWWLSRERPPPPSPVAAALSLQLVRVGEAEAVAPTAAVLAQPAVATPVQVAPGSAPAPAQASPAASAASPVQASAPDPTTAQPAEPYTDCNIEEHLRRRLSSDPRVAHVFAALPKNALSVANAIQLWNGEWSVSDTIAAADLRSLQDLIYQTVAAARPACLDAPMQGPRMIFVPGDGRTIVVSLGSGAWRWSDLRPPTQPALAAR